MTLCGPPRARGCQIVTPTRVDNLSTNRLLDGSSGERRGGARRASKSLCPSAARCSSGTSGGVLGIDHRDVERQSLRQYRHANGLFEHSERRTRSRSVCPMPPRVTRPNAIIVDSTDRRLVPLGTGRDLVDDNADDPLGDAIASRPHSLKFGYLRPSPLCN
jgi:hypothetical protein